MKKLSVVARGLLRRLVPLAVVLFVGGSAGWLLFEDGVPFQTKTAPLPSVCFKAEDWYAYLRKHPEIPMHFYRIRPDSKGAVYVRGDDYVALEEATGGLPTQQITGYVDKQGIFWTFDFQKNTYVRPSGDK